MSAYHYIQAVRTMGESNWKLWEELRRRTKYARQLTMNCVHRDARNGDKEAQALLEAFTAAAVAKRLKR